MRLIQKYYRLNNDRAAGNRFGLLKNLLSYLFLSSAFIATGAASAKTLENELSWAERTQWQAFLSQALIYTSDNNFFSDSDDTVSAEMWEAGVLLNVALAERWDYSMQLLGRRISEWSDEDIRLDYAFFSYALLNSQNHNAGFRAGRIRSSYGLYNETRDIPHTRTGIVMPQSVYFDKTRNTFFSSDGLEFYGHHDFDDRRLSYQLFVSKPFADQDEARESLLPVNDVEGQHSLLAKVSYGNELDGLRTAFTYYRPQYKFDISEALIVSDKKFYSETMVSSIEYNHFDWSLTAEYLRMKFRVLGVQVDFTKPLSVFFRRAYYGEAFYLQAVRRWDEHWETYLRYEWSEDREYDASWRDSRDTNIGVSYRPDNHWLFRIEGHYVEGSANLLARDNFSSRTKYWHALMTQIAYRW